MFSRLRKKPIVWILVFILALGTGGFVYYRATYLPATATNEPEAQTSVVRRGDILNYASGGGTLIALNQVQLGFGTVGPLAELHVQVGEHVSAGAVLAIQGDRHELEAAVTADELEVKKAEQTLADLQANASLVAAQAQLSLANATDEAESARWNWTVQQEGNRATQATLERAETELKLARSALDDVAAKLYSDPDNSVLLQQRESAQKRYDTALANWNWYHGQPTVIEQMVLDAQLALAKAELERAQRQYDKVKDGPPADEIASAELQLANAQAKLATSRSNLEHSTIVAPFDGTILSINAEVGENVSGPFITLADLSQLFLEIYLDEADIGNLKVGYAVEAIFDAYPDQVFTGEVTQVDPSLRTSGTVSTLRGLVRLDMNSDLPAEGLLLGMSAAVDVIASRAEGVALVPVEALRELSPGEYAVFVLDGEELVLRPVEVGLTDFTFAEIRSGLQVGEVVSTGIVETQ